jgi:hypothetical protein
MQEKLRAPLISMLDKEDKANKVRATGGEKLRSY